MSDRIMERLLRQIDVSECGCWLWTGSRVTWRGQRTYGRIYVGGTGRNALAHRVSYQLFRGPIRHKIDHVCRTQRCVNPDHLRDVPHTENMSFARFDYCKNGHRLTEATTYRHKNGNRTCRACKALTMQRIRAARKESP